MLWFFGRVLFPAAQGLDDVDLEASGLDLVFLDGLVDEGEQKRGVLAVIPDDD